MPSPKSHAAFVPETENYRLINCSVVGKPRWTPSEKKRQQNLAHLGIMSILLVCKS